MVEGFTKLLWSALVREGWGAGVTLKDNGERQLELKDGENLKMG